MLSSYVEFELNVFGGLKISLIIKKPSLTNIFLAEAQFSSFFCPSITQSLINSKQSSVYIHALYSEVRIDLFD